MIPRALGIIVLVLAACLPAHASQIVPLDLDKLASQSKLIVLGVVTAITDSDDASDTVSVRVISPLKGKSEAKSFSLRLRNKGVKGFDPTLAVGDQGVFFLKSIEGGRADLTYWGSIAVMPKKENFSVPGKPDNGSVPKATGTLAGKPVQFPVKGVADGVNATIALLESCSSLDADTLTTADLKKAQQGDHIRLVFAKPVGFTVLGKKFEVSELVFTQPSNTGVFWLQAGDKVVRCTKFEFQKERLFNAWREQAQAAD